MLLIISKIYTNLRKFDGYTSYSETCFRIDGVGLNSFTKVLFRSKKFLDFDTIALSFLFDKYMSNHGVTRLKIFVSRFKANCAISFYFHLYLILHACAAIFDVIGKF